MATDNLHNYLRSPNEFVFFHAPYGSAPKREQPRQEEEEEKSIKEEAPVVSRDREGQRAVRIERDNPEQKNPVPAERESALSRVLKEKTKEALGIKTFTPKTRSRSEALALFGIDQRVKEYAENLCQVSLIPR